MSQKQINRIFSLCAAIALMLLFGIQAVQPVSASSAGNRVYLPLVTRGCSGPCPYYVSSSQGADSNSGMDSAHPFKSIAKVNSLNLAPGSKLLFKCGDMWRGEMLVISKSGSAGAPLTYASYPAGCSDQPRLDGTQPVTGWTTYATHIYVADLNAGANLAAFRSPDGKTNYAINQLFRGGQRLGMGRWPNLDAGDGGYATISAQPAGNQITSSVALPGGSWSGATIHLKVMRWSMVNRDVSAQNGSTLTLNDAVTCPYTTNCSGWGFFINNSLNTLDRDGEWAYDKAARKVYLYSSTDPNGASMEASPVYKSDGRSWGAINLGVDSAAAVHDVVVDNFAVRGWFGSGIVSPTNLHPDENSGLTLSNNHLSDLDDTGISLWSWVWGASDGEDGWRGGNNILIQGNLIDGANHFGIHTPSRLTTIDHNTIRNIGVIANLNESGLGCGKTGNEGSCTEDGAGLRIYVDRPDRSGYGFTVQYNRFENIAYNGIQMFGGSSTFANNVFIYICMAKGDGGAINTFGSGNMGSSSVHDIQILNNIILYTIGNTDGANSKYRDLFGFGVYLDQASLNVTTRGNTIAYSTAAGILYQMANGVVENNTLFDNVSGTMWSDQVRLTASPAALSAFNGNIMVANNDHSRNLGLNSPAQISAADNNRYYHTLNAGMQVNLNGASQSLAQWQAASGKDAHAKSGTTAFAATLQLYVNDGAASKTITASGGSFTDLDGNPLGTSFVLGPYSSRVVAHIPRMDSDIPLPPG